MLNNTIKLQLIDVIMEQKEEKQRKRKQDIKRGVRTQKMMSFRCDNETIELLKDYPNKGRLINKLIKNYFKNGEE